MHWMKCTNFTPSLSSEQDYSGGKRLEVFYERWCRRQLESSIVTPLSDRSWSFAVACRKWIPHAWRSTANLVPLALVEFPWSVFTLHFSLISLSPYTHNIKPTGPEKFKLDLSHGCLTLLSNARRDDRACIFLGLFHRPIRKLGLKMRRSGWKLGNQEGAKWTESRIHKTNWGPCV